MGQNSSADWEYMHINFHIHYTYRIVFICRPCLNIPIFFFQLFAFIILFFNLLFQSDPTSMAYGWAPLAGPRSLRSPSLLNLVTHTDMRQPSQHWNFAPFIARMGV